MYADPSFRVDSCVYERLNARCHMQRYLRGHKAKTTQPIGGEDGGVLRRLRNASQPILEPPVDGFAGNEFSADLNDALDYEFGYYVTTHVDHPTGDLAEMARKQGVRL